MTGPTPEQVDAELARRIEWATGRNGAHTLAQLRSEGLDVTITAPEEVADRG